MARHEIGLRISARLDALTRWADDRGRVARDLQELVHAIMLMFAGNPSSPHTVVLGGETFMFRTGPIYENFLNEQAGPGGPKWAPWSPAYAASRKARAGTVKSGRRKGQARMIKILTLTGKLCKEATAARSITVEVGSSRVTATMIVDAEQVPYAKIHDEGGVIPAHRVSPKQAKALAWMWMVKGGEVVKGPFFSRGHEIPAITMPQREFLTVGDSIPARYRTVLDNMIQAWFKGIMRGGAGRIAYEVKSHA